MLGQAAHLGFTIAELLITLGIIGIVAVLLLPRAFDYIEEQQFDAARKVVLKNVGEAVRLVSLNTDIRSANDAEDFVENYLRKELKILKTCNNEKLRECGIETKENGIYTIAETHTTMPTTINDLATNMSKGTYIDPSAESYGFVLSNGYSANLFYNKNCISDNKDSAHYVQDMMCEILIIYDLNGLSSPNQVGKDIGFVTIFYPGIEMRAVSPIIYNNNTNGATFYTVSKLCANINSKLKGPDKEEAQAIYINNFALGGAVASYITTTSADLDYAWTMSASSGFLNKYEKNRGSWFRCVK